MIHSTLSNSMSVANLAPKAATKLPDSPRREGAFGEALAGAHTVHDRRESHASERGLERGRAIGSTDRSRVKDDDQVDTGHARKADRASEAAPDDDPAVVVNSDGTVRVDRTDAEAVPTGTVEADPAVAVELQAEGALNVVAEGETAEVATPATVAVAAAPVTDLDAIIVPTTTTTTQAAATDAVGAAIRLAIEGDVAPKQVTIDAAPTTTPTTVATTNAPVAADIDVEVQLATAGVTLRGAEDTEGGDAKAGPTSPTASTPSTTSGPSPAQVAATTSEAPVDTDPTDPTVPALHKIATAPAEGVATGETVDAGVARLVQSAVVEASTAAPADAADVVTIKAATLEASGAAAAPGADMEVVDADVAQVAQVARNMQGQSTTVAANAQFQALVQAKSAEGAAAEEGGDAAPAKVEAATNTLPPSLASAEGDVLPAGVRVREGVLASGIQERIDHIAEQLATRLKLSQAAGGSQVQLSLKPRELGEVSVTMNIRDGVVAATVLVDRADTLRTLETNLAELKRSLEDQGLSIQEFSVDVRGDTGPGGANARAAADLRHNATRTSSGSAASVAGAASVIPGLSGDREVDPDAIHDGNVSVLA